VLRGQYGFAVKLVFVDRERQARCERQRQVGLSGTSSSPWTEVADARASFTVTPQMYDSVGCQCMLSVVYKGLT
jgi:hypothetical protein